MHNLITELKEEIITLQEHKTALHEHNAGQDRTINDILKKVNQKTTGDKNGT